MVFEIISVISFLATVSMGIVVYRLNSSVDDKIDLAIKTTISELEDNWVADTNQLIDALDAENDDIRLDILSCAKSPNKAKISLKEKYKHLM